MLYKNTQFYVDKNGSIAELLWLLPDKVSAKMKLIYFPTDKRHEGKVVEVYLRFWHPCTTIKITIPFIL